MALYVAKYLYREILRVTNSLLVICIIKGTFPPPSYPHPGAFTFCNLKDRVQLDGFSSAFGSGDAKKSIKFPLL